MPQAWACCSTACNKRKSNRSAVVVCDPAVVKDVLTGAPAVLRAGEGNRPLEPVVGPQVLEQRRHRLLDPGRRL